jgi:hypothetical protein
MQGQRHLKFKWTPPAFSRFPSKLRDCELRTCIKQHFFAGPLRQSNPVKVSQTNFLV